MRLNLKQIAAYTGGRFIVDPDDAAELLTSITWDSREVEPGALYVALPGERVDGHSFVASALRAGARAALVSGALDDAALLSAREMGAAVIEVPSTANAVTDLARAWRGHLKGLVIGLTGSTGKTTTKNLVRDVASAAKSVVATKANQNNELGVPRTLLNADPETEVVVVEMGMRGMGQIASLCEFVKPDWGVVTNVGDSHIELLGSRENIARAKAELLCALPANVGRAFVNAADGFAWQLADIAQLAERNLACVGFDGSGSSALCDGVAASSRAAEGVRGQLPRGPRVWAEGISLDTEGCPRFTLCACGFEASAAAGALVGASVETREGVEAAGADACAVKAPAVGRVSVHLGLRGLHNVINAAAAAAVGLSLGMDLPTIATALASSLPEGGRQEVLAARGGFTVVNDAYNANPDSMKASLATFCAMSAKGKRYAVLGDMGELGDFSEACHRDVGAAAAGLPLEGLVCVGELSAHIAQAAQDAGMAAEKIVRAATVADVLEALEAQLEPGDAVLVKASHFMGLTRVVEGLVN